MKERENIDQIKKFSNRCWFAVIGAQPSFNTIHSILRASNLYVRIADTGYEKKNNEQMYPASNINCYGDHRGKNAGTNQISVFLLAFFWRDLFSG